MAARVHLRKRVQQLHAELVVRNRQVRVVFVTFEGDLPYIDILMVVHDYHVLVPVLAEVRVGPQLPDLRFKALNPHVVALQIKKAVPFLVNQEPVAVVAVFVEEGDALHAALEALVVVHFDTVRLVGHNVKRLRLDRLWEDLDVVIRLNEKPEFALAPQQELLEAAVVADCVDLVPELLQGLERLSVNHTDLLLVSHAQQGLTAADVEHLVLTRVLVDQLQILGVEKIVLELAVLHEDQLRPRTLRKSDVLDEGGALGVERHHCLVDLGQRLCGLLASFFGETPLELCVLRVQLAVDLLQGLVGDLNGRLVLLDDVLEGLQFLLVELPEVVDVVVVRGEDVLVLDIWGHGELLQDPLVLLGDFGDVLLEVVYFFLDLQFLELDVVFANHNQTHVVFEAVLVLFEVEAHVLLDLLQDLLLLALVENPRRFLPPARRHTRRGQPQLLNGRFQVLLRNQLENLGQHRVQEVRVARLLLGVLVVLAKQKQTLAEFGRG